MKKISLLLALAAISGAAHGALTFDSITGVTLGYGGASTNRTLMGQAFNFGGTTGAQTLTGMDIVLASLSTSTVSYTDLTLQVTFFDTYNAGAASTASAFSNPLATLTVDFGAQTLTGSTVYTINGGSTGPDTTNGPGITFSGAPITFSGTSNKGVQFIWRGATTAGATPTITNDLTTAIRGGAGESAIAVGSGASGASPSFGYFRNASNAAPTTTATSLLISDGRQVGANSALAFRLYTTAQATPEPASFAALGVGALALLRRRKRA